MRYAVLATTVVLAACSSSTERGPVLPSSGGRTVYAVRYNEELAASVKAFGDAQEREKTLVNGLPAHVEELKKTDWEKVSVIVDDSDEAGKSADFAGVQEDTKAVKDFWNAEKNEISSRVAGNAQHTVKQAGCTAEVGGSVAFALNDAVNKQLQKRLRAHNEAFLVMDRYKTSLGLNNIPSLEKLADEVSEASYNVHVALVVERNKMRRVAADKDDVKKTLDRFIQEETAYQAEPGRTEAEKKSSADRVTAANQGKASLDGAATQAEATVKEADAAIQAASKEYDEALASLRAKLAEKKKAEPPAAKAKANASLRSHSPARM